MGCDQSKIDSISEYSIDTFPTMKDQGLNPQVINLSEAPIANNGKLKENKNLQEEINRIVLQLNRLEYEKKQLNETLNDKMEIIDNEFKRLSTQIAYLLKENQDHKKENQRLNQLINQLSNIHPSGLKQIKSSRKLTILIVGRTGAGKSSLANKIAGKEIFKEGHSMFSETFEIQAETITWPLQNDVEITIVDTPGFGDNRAGLENSALLMKITTLLTKIKDGFNVCLFCTQAKPRFDEHDIEELKVLGLLLGEDVFKHMWIAVTQMNNLLGNAKKNYYEKYPEHLPKLLREHGVKDISRDNIFFADFDAFDDNFMIPLHNALADTSHYVPESAKGLDINDPSTFITFLDSAPMKKYMEHIKSLYEKQIKELHAQQAMIQKDYQKRPQNEKPQVNALLKEVEMEMEGFQRLKGDMERNIKFSSKNWFLSKWNSFKSNLARAFGR